MTRSNSRVKVGDIFVTRWCDTDYDTQAFQVISIRGTTQAILKRIEMAATDRYGTNAASRKRDCFGYFSPRPSHFVKIDSLYAGEPVERRCVVFMTEFMDPYVVINWRGRHRAYKWDGMRAFARSWWYR